MDTLVGLVESVSYVGIDAVEVPSLEEEVAPHSSTSTEDHQPTPGLTYRVRALNARIQPTPHSTLLVASVFIKQITYLVGGHVVIARCLCDSVDRSTPDLRAILLYENRSLKSINFISASADSIGLIAVV